MKIIISKKSGYCMGVKRAFSNSLEVSKNYKNIVIFGEMVHNRFALNSLTERGIIIENDLNKIINNKNLTNVIIRAHGIPPVQEELLLKNNKKIFDFTCPIVKQVQLLAKKLSEQGYEIIITGKVSHPEVIGITGYCTNKYYVVKDINDVKKIDIKNIKKLALISQTTMNSDKFNEILNYLKAERSDIKYHNTLCNLPLKIQEESINLAKKVDLMIVVGDKMSANTTTLYDKLKNITDTIFIETKEELDIDNIRNYKTIGITGGSSTPDWQMNEIKDYIEKKV